VERAFAPGRARDPGVRCGPRVRRVDAASVRLRSLEGPSAPRHALRHPPTTFSWATSARPNDSTSPPSATA
jgi:hypothetical protein